jgi:hypothetical protein
VKPEEGEMDEEISILNVEDTVEEERKEGEKEIVEEGSIPETEGSETIDITDEKLDEVLKEVSRQGYVLRWHLRRRGGCIVASCGSRYIYVSLYHKVKGFWCSLGIKQAFYLAHFSHCLVVFYSYMTGNGSR